MTRQPAPRAPRAPAGRSAEVRREIVGEREWLRLTLTADDGATGQSWAAYTDGVQHSLEAALGLASQSAAAAVASATEHHIAHSLLAAAEADVVCRRHARPLHRWLGGPLRRRVEVAWPLLFQTSRDSGRGDEIARETTRAATVAERWGVSSFVVHDGARNVDLIATTIRAVRGVLGITRPLSLRLAGQFDRHQTEALLDRVRDAALICVADPCASITESIDATAGRLPALGLTAVRYDRQHLLDCLSRTPPAVLVIDPLLEGGPGGVRRIASIARVLRTSISLTAEAGGPWLTNLCAELAAVLPAVSQPIELPSLITPDALAHFGVAAGALSLASSLPRDAAFEPRHVEDGATSTTRG
jgi:L-alanine-DL-glutamate epimerase-like enolase superfamily enzyme